ncbi:MAG: PPE family protein, partial [Mycobacteriaceae bacterium]|nr:PPE family protein [Mycobacteriaceae bacterium]
MSAPAAVPYLVWLNATAEQATQTSGQAEAAVAACEAAYAMTVPPAVIAANRVQLATLTQMSTRAMTTSESRLELPTLRILPEAVG